LKFITYTAAISATTVAFLETISDHFYKDNNGWQNVNNFVNTKCNVTVHCTLHSTQYYTIYCWQQVSSSTTNFYNKYTAFSTASTGEFIYKHKELMSITVQWIEPKQCSVSVEELFATPLPAPPLHQRPAAQSQSDDLLTTIIYILHRSLFATILHLLLPI